MYTRCPSCHTVFHLHASQLTAARGQVRCGDCGEIFQSLDYLYDDPDRALAKLAPLKAGAAARHVGRQARPEPDRQPVADVADVPAEAQSQAEVVAQDAEEEDLTGGAPPPKPQADGAVAQTADGEPEQASQDTVEVESVAEASEVSDTSDLPGTARPYATKVEPAAEASERSGTSDASGTEQPYTTEVEPVAEASDTSATPDTEQPLPAGEPPELPRFEIPPDLILQSTTERISWSTARVTGWIAVAVLSLGLLSQGIYASRETLATEPALAPWIAGFCNLFGCELPPTRDLADIQVLERLVRQHPQGKDVLLVHTTLVNKAPFVQPYPILELRLADLSGGLVAGRRFRPSEYLPENADIEAGMRPDVPVTAKLELVRPDIDVVSYQFDFL
jgi:predicted Zn finger-like uncharacterized protein